MGKALALNKQIGALRKKMETQLDIENVFTDLRPELQATLTDASQYNDFRRVENERQLEAIKAMLGAYMFNENVIVRGTTYNKKGEPEVIELSRFEVMMKASNLFLSAMNMQNKMWGLYSPPTSDKPPDGGGGDANAHFKRMSAMAHELQRIAKKALPAPTPTLKAKVVENGQ